jgi:glycosyltransferase involved in cell wall biosynthesis
LRVLMVAPTSFFAHYGGHIRIMEEALALQALGHQVTIVSYYKGEDVAGLAVERTPPLPWHTEYEVGSSRHKLAFDAFLLAKTLQVGRRVQPDIVHGHMHEGALIGGALARVLHVPLVFDFQGSLSGEMIDHGFVRPSSVGHRFWSRVERWICALPQAILVSSLRAKPLLEEQFGVPAAKIQPLPDCADMQHFDPTRFSEAEKAAVRRQLGIPEGRTVVVYLGLLADYQGTPQLLQAAQNLRASGEDIHFLIMGFPNVEHYLQMAHSLGVQENVTFTGRVDYLTQAPAYLSVGDIAVSPKFSATEGSGKVLNYMAMAQPVVAFDTAVHHEYLGESGVYVPRGDVPAMARAIAALAHNAERRRVLGAALQLRATQRFSWQAAAYRIQDVYCALTGAPRVAETFSSKGVNLREN